MKLLVRTLPILFFVLLFILITLVITGFWVRNQKIMQIPQKVIDSAVSIFTNTKETENISPDSGFTTSNGSVSVEITGLGEGTTIINGADKQPVVLTIENNTAKTDLKLEPGINVFRLTTFSSADFTVQKESTFVYFRNEDPLPENSKAIYGKVISTLGNNIELKSLISGNKFTLSTDSSTAYLFVNPREENDGKLDQGLKDIDKLEVDDIVVGVGALKDTVQNTKKLISYSNKEPVTSLSSSLKSGQIASADLKRELLTLDGDKTKYYWDKNSQISQGSFPGLKKGQQIFFIASPNSYGNLIIRNVLIVK